MERPDGVLWKGIGQTLVGAPVQVGDRVNDFRVHDKAFCFVHGHYLDGTVRFFSTVPSIATSTCSLQTRTFNKHLQNLPGAGRFFTVSADLPYALNDFCGAQGIDRMETLSDHYDLSFGTAFGIHVKERRLLARAVFVVDKEGIVRYAEMTPEIASEPHYDAALQVLNQLLQT